MFSTPLPYAAIIAFTALGAHLLGTGLLILSNPHSRSVRWHAAFTFWIMAWLALQGWFASGLGGPRLLPAYGWVVHLMPTFFAAAALVETRRINDVQAAGVIALGVLTAPFLNPITGGSLSIAWQAAAWGLGSLLHFRQRAASPPRAAGATAVRGEGLLKLVLLVIVPIAVIGVIVLSGAFVLYVMPVITMLIQVLIFIGVVHHRFYDIEVRAARSSELASRAAERERLALLGELSATLAHEIRNPLTGMRSLAQRLADTDIEPQRRARYAGVILGEVDRLERIVGNLLDMGRRTSFAGDTSGPTPLEPLFDDLFLLVNGRARSARVSLEQDAAGLVAAAPRDALAQSLLNLLINAVSHTPPGGRVRVSALRAGDIIEVRVSDSGPGIPSDERDHIFEPFHTRGLGAGLGLAVVRRIANEMDWQVGVVNGAELNGGGAPGSLPPLDGACFHLRVPAAS